MEEDLASYIQDQRLKGCAVSRKEIQRKAKEICADDPTFKASGRWLKGFLNRQGFSLRRVTTTGQKVPEQYVYLIVKFWVQVSDLRYVFLKHEHKFC
jgi:hypothetical protein